MARPRCSAAAGQGDGDGIHWAFHDYRDCPSGELVLKNSVQLRAFVEKRCFAGVQVFRSCSIDIAEVGMPSTNESKHLAVVDDREDDPVPEAVDEPAGACHGGDTGDDHFVVADPMSPEVIFPRATYHGAIRRHRPRVSEWRQGPPLLIGQERCGGLQRPWTACSRTQ